MITFVRSQISLDREVDEIRQAGRAQVGAAIDAVRRKYITSIAGQELTYMEKEREARAFLLLDPLAVLPGDYPFLAAEANVTGQSLALVAQAVVDRAAQWRTIGAQIEAARMAAQGAIAAAMDAAAVAAAVSALEGALAEF